MRLISLSLAAKYRLLFGLAVLLIIGAALWVPWYRMETLVLEQPLQEARRIADDYFRLTLPVHAEGAVPAAAGVHAEGLDARRRTFDHQPRFVPRPPTVDRLRPLEAEAAAAQFDPFVSRAFGTFTRQPAQQHVAQVTEADGTPVHRYAFAVRVSKSCLACHDEGQTAEPYYRENELAGLITVHMPADASRAGLLLNRVIIVVAGALAGMFAILVFYLITHRFILGPIEELSGVAERVAEGDLEVRSTLRTGDEFEQLADSMNTMLARLRDSQEELKRANRALDQKLGELAETNVGLYEANRIKSEFLANVSHELRTPLTSIIGFAELLRESPISNEYPKNTRYAENILISGRILLEIINDLLDLAKIEAGKVELQIGPVDVATLCTTLIDFLAPQTEKKRLEVRFTEVDALPEIRTDGGRLRQILFNLLSNAVKFTPEHGVIWVRARCAPDGGVAVEVQDTGPGIPPEKQDIIFDKFRQIDQSATREHHGTGLGLAIAKELTVLLGGRISVASTVGEGATFCVELPRQAPRQSHQRDLMLV
jgi:two-component system, NarL family, sensor histidine kinase BarA